MGVRAHVTISAKIKFKGGGLCTKTKRRLQLFLWHLLIFIAMLAPSQEAFANSVTDGEKAAIETRCKSIAGKR